MAKRRTKTDKIHLVKKTPVEMKPIMDLGEYTGKIDFVTDGLKYQLKIRDEWR